MSRRNIKVLMLVIPLALKVIGRRACAQPRHVPVLVLRMTIYTAVVSVFFCRFLRDHADEAHLVQRLQCHLGALARATELHLVPVARHVGGQLRAKQHLLVVEARLGDASRDVQVRHALEDRGEEQRADKRVGQEILTSSLLKIPVTVLCSRQPF